jgi:hypothetical protein
MRVVPATDEAIERAVRRSPHLRAIIKMAASGRRLSRSLLQASFQFPTVRQFF